MGQNFLDRQEFLKLQEVNVFIVRMHEISFGTSRLQNNHQVLPNVIEVVLRTHTTRIPVVVVVVGGGGDSQFVART